MSQSMTAGQRNPAVTKKNPVAPCQETAVTAAVTRVVRSNRLLRANETNGRTTES